MQSYCLQIDEEGREKTAHIRDGFPVAMYETHPRRYPIGYTIWHWHWEIQFCWVVQGEIEFYVEENRYHLTKGQGIFINRGTLHMAKAVHSEEDAYICMDIAGCGEQGHSLFALHRTGGSRDYTGAFV